MEQRRLFEDLIESDVVAHKTGPGEDAARLPRPPRHVLVFIIIVPLLQPAELPEPAAAVRAFFVEPMSAPPPPPPAPAPGPQGGRCSRSRSPSPC